MWLRYITEPYAFMKARPLFLYFSFPALTDALAGLPYRTGKFARSFALLPMCVCVCVCVSSTLFQS